MNLLCFFPAFFSKSSRTPFSPFLSLFTVKKKKKNQTFCFSFNVWGSPVQQPKETAFPMLLFYAAVPSRLCRAALMLWFLHCHRFVSPPRCHGTLNKDNSFWSQALQDLETCGQSGILRELEVGGLLLLCPSDSLGLSQL